MNFGVFAQITISQKNLLLDHCHSAERNVRIEPFNSIASARAALDLLCIQLLKSKNLYTKQNLFKMVGLCVQEGLFASESAAHFVRDHGNCFVHTNKAKQVVDIPLDECLHTISYENVRLAENVTRNLYQIMCEAFGIRRKFDRDQIPFGEYQVRRKVAKGPGEIIVWDYNYFVKNADNDCYYIQILPRKATSAEGKALVNRNRHAAAIVREDREPKAFLKNTRVLFGHCDDSEMEYVAYPAHTDSYMLSELATGVYSSLTPSQAIQVCLDLLDTLIEMSELEQGLHHRNICPACVMLTPSRKTKLRGSLINFQTAKIENNDTTIKRYLRGIYDANMFAHPDIRQGDLRRFDRYWEQADVYSVAAVLSFCVNPETKQTNVDIATLEDYFSEEMVDFLVNRIFDSSLAAVCTLKEFRKVMNHEADKQGP